MFSCSSLRAVHFTLDAEVGLVITLKVRVRLGVRAMGSRKA